MIEAVTSLFSAFGLSASAGLNAYLPLLIVAFAARFTNWITLAPPFDLLAHPISLAVITILLIIETFADKIPAFNHVNDIIQTLIRPTAGAILFAASTQVITQLHPVVAIVLGILVAGGVHVAKAAVIRPTVTAITGGIANPVVSIIEDVIAAVVSILAIVLPAILTALVIICTAFILWMLWRRANREAAQAR